MVAGYAGWVALMLPLYRLVDPPLSNLMLVHLLAGQTQRQTWTPLSRISPALLRSVLISEDGNYCQHWGVDWVAIQEAMQHNGGGASTIPMQTVKNLFLWNGRTVLRKLPELPLAYLANLIWASGGCWRSILTSPSGDRAFSAWKRPRNTIFTPVPQC